MIERSCRWLGEQELYEEKRRATRRDIKSRKYASFPRSEELRNSLLFNFEGPKEIWGYSSAGRAPALQAGGQRFDPAYLHQGWKHPENPKA